MQTDRYTKFILTIIAFALLFLCADRVYKIAIPQAVAKTGKWDCWHLTNVNASLTEHMNQTNFKPGTVFSLKVNTAAAQASMTDTYCGWVE